MTTSESIDAPLARVGDDDEIDRLDGVPWRVYERMLRLRGERAVPRLTYLDGALEIMAPSRHHERRASNIGCMVEAWCIDHGIEVSPVGSWTIRDESEGAGAEPDECYVFGDPDDDTLERPDLAIEVIWTSGSIDKLEVYRRLGVGEVWIWQDGVISVHVLEQGAYRGTERSRCLPELDVSVVAQFAAVKPMTRAVREFRAALRGR